VQTGLLEGVVPELEEREAAVFCGYTWKEWLGFDLLDLEGRYQRSAGIAHYRLHHIIQQHTDDAINDEISRQSKSHA